MTPENFIDKWKASTLKERSAAQSHFNDLCDLLGVEKPVEADPHGEWYCFEKGASKTAGGEGWADVWRRGSFGWEYKGKRKDLKAAFAQLQQYAVALENPPLLIVSDMDRIEVHTNWTNTVSETHVIFLDDLVQGATRDLLRSAFVDPERLKPSKTVDSLTQEAADKFASLAIRLRSLGHDAHAVAHFVNRLVFCMFAEDIDLLPRNVFSQILDRGFADPAAGVDLLRDLFVKMSAGGYFGVDRIAWFNGGLFDDDTAVSLNREDFKLIGEAADLDWSDIDPSIFGTLFERGLDPAKRSQLGAHYTDRDKIMMIVRPVIIEPLTREWQHRFSEITAFINEKDAAEEGVRAVQKEASELYKQDEKKARETEEARKRRVTRYKSVATASFNKAKAVRDAFLKHLRDYRVLDPACGSGNFLYLALHALKDLDHRVRLDCEALGIERGAHEITPECVLGLELNSYAAELARVSVWIGEIQWMRKNGFDVGRDPILKPLNTIQNRDALLNEDGSAYEWPFAHVIIGNPPFLGSRKLQPELGAEYVSKLRAAYGDKIPDGADLVTFWFYKAGLKLARETERAGLVATNSIADGRNRVVLEGAANNGKIFDAWSDQPWTVEGASVRVAIVCIARPNADDPVSLDGVPADQIYADLTARRGNVGLDLTKACKLPENKGIAFQGVVPRGSLNKKDAERLSLAPGTFLVEAKKAGELLAAVGNPNGRPNSDVVVPYLIGEEIVKRPQGRYIVDFCGLDELGASLYERPFAHIAAVRDHRANMNQKEALATWWQHWNSRPAMRKALAGRPRYIATPRVAKHRIFRFVPTSVLADNMVVAIARDDDITFGILHSRFHEMWTLRMCSYLGVGNDPRYTPSTTFETFPFPTGLEPDRSAEDRVSNKYASRIADASRALNEARERWLNPQELTGVEIDPALGMPLNIHGISDDAEQELKKRTLTRLYNEQPNWLIALHGELNAAVAAAYGWEADINEDNALAALFALNQNRCGARN